jgi:hypothetical protein
MQNVLNSGINVFVIAFTVALSFAISPTAQATLISIDDLTDNLAATIDSTLNTSGYSQTIVNETLLGPVDPRTGQPTPAQPGAVYINYQYTGNNPPAASLSVGFNIVEPGTLNNVLSDTLSIQVTNGLDRGIPFTIVNLTFFSDNEAATSPLQSVNGLFIVETGDWQTVDTGWSELSVRFRSDVAGAPEPATLALLGLSLAGLGFSRRKRAS